MANPLGAVKLLKYSLQGGNKVASKLDKFGELSLLGIAKTEDTERLIPIANNFVDDTMTTALSASKEEILNNQTTLRLYNNYKTGINRVLGGETGLRWLAKNTPPEFKNELEGIIGGVKERITEDLYELSKINPNELSQIQLGKTAFTKGHLSVIDYKKNNPAMNILDDNLSYIENTLKEVTKPLIDNSTRFNNFEDFQRKTMNYSILDKIATNAEMAIRYPSAQTFKNFNDFNRSYAMVFQGTEKVRPELFPVLNNLIEIGAKNDLSHFADNFKMHYYDPQSTNKYVLNLDIYPGGPLRPMSESNRLDLNVVPDNIYEQGLQKGITADTKMMHFDITRIDDLAIKDRGDRLQETLNKLGFTTEFNNTGTGKELFIKVSNDNQEMDAYNLIRKFAVSDSVNDTINMKKALATLDYNALVNSSDMSPQSLGMYLTESLRAKNTKSRAILRGEQGVFSEPEMATKMMQDVNDITDQDGVKNLAELTARIEPVSADGVTPDGMLLNVKDLDKPRGYVSGHLASGLPRSYKGDVIFDPTAKNIQVDGMFQTFKEEDTALNIGDLHAHIRDVAQKNPNIGLEGGFKGLLQKVYTSRTGKNKLIDKISIKDKLALAQSSLKAISNNGSLRELARDLDTTPKSVVESVARYLAEIEELAQGMINKDFKLKAKGLDEYKFDDYGNITQGSPEWTIQIHHTPIRQGKFMNVEEAVNSLKAFVPPIFGLNFEFISDDIKES